MKRVAALGALILVAGLVSGAGAATADSSALSDTPPPYEQGKEYPATDDMVAVVDKWPSVPEMPAALSERYTKIHRDMELHPEFYTGIWQTTDNGCAKGLAIVVGVQRGRAPATRDRLAREGLPDNCGQGISIEESDQSLAARLYQILVEAYSTLPDVNATAIDWHRHLVVISMDDMSDGVRKQAKSLYGNEVALEIMPKASLTSGSRQYDTGPFTAGADFKSYDPDNMATELRSCSFGIPWKLGSQHQFMVTAGHCLPGDWGTQGVKTPTEPPGGYGAGRLYGNGMTGSTWDECASTINGNGDLALIDHRYWPYGASLNRSSENFAYFGDKFTSARASIPQWGTANVGATIYPSGATSGDMTGGPGYWTVESTDATHSPTAPCGTPTIHQQTRATKGWHQGPQSGDSGGPVIRPSDYNIVGVISASSGGGSDHYVDQFEPGDITVWFTAARFASYLWGGGMN